MTDWRDLLAAEVRQLEAEAGNPALTPKALALLRVIRGYERRVRQLALKSDYRVARTFASVTELVTEDGLGFLRTLTEKP